MSKRSAIALSVLITAAAAVAFWLAKPTTTSADKRPNVPRLKSYHANMKSTIHQSDGTTTMKLMEDWYQYPGKKRSDISSDKTILGAIVNGDQTVTYNTSTGYAVIEPASEGAATLVDREASKMVPTSDLPQTVGMHRVAGEEKIAGRTCDKLQWEQQGSTYTMCLDKETGYPLRMTGVGPGKRQTDMVVTSLDTEQPVPDSVFDAGQICGVRIVRNPIADSLLTQAFVIGAAPFAPPNGMTFENLRPASVTIPQLTTSMSTAGRRQIGDIFAPSYVPVRFKLAVAAPRPIKTGTHNRSSVSYGKQFNSIEIDYVDPKTGDALVLLESAGKPTPGEKPLQANGFSGNVTRRSSPFSYTILTWKKSGTYVQLGGANVAEDELLKVAKSLRVLTK